MLSQQCSVGVIRAGRKDEITRTDYGRDLTSTIGGPAS
jgi:hypothetical protein